MIIPVFSARRAIETALLLLSLLLTSHVGASPLVAFDYSTSWVDRGYKGIVFESGAALLLRTSPDFRIWQLQVSSEERAEIERLLRAANFFALPLENTRDVTDGASTRLSSCSKNECRTVHEYQGDTAEARTIRELYSLVSRQLSDKTGTARILSPRQARALLTSELTGAKEMEKSAAEVFASHMRRTPPHSDDSYICYDPGKETVYVSETPAAGCREQLVWQPFSSTREERYEGFICTFGTSSIFTREPLNEIGIVSPLKPRQWCAPAGFECKGTVEFVDWKQCSPRDMNDIWSMNEATFPPVGTECPAGLAARIRTLKYREPCNGSEACYLGTGRHVLQEFENLRVRDDVRPRESRLFEARTIVVPPELERNIESRGVYCIESERVGGAEALRSIRLIRVGPPAPPTAVPGEPIPRFTCHTDEDCFEIGNSCAVRVIAEPYYAKLGKTAVHGACECVRGPTVFGCRKKRGSQ